MRGYAWEVCSGLSHFLNAIFGGKGSHTLCCRIGLHIRAGGWLGRVWMPDFVLKHLLDESE
jgi:hypothetical protein